MGDYYYNDYWGGGGYVASFDEEREAEIEDILKIK
ncbi:hypothetical protein A2U01_0103271, partial [Trifolium medium]|nr:hypothetical protein [Trifolium medium]